MHYAKELLHHRWSTGKTVDFVELAVQSTSLFRLWLSAEFIFTLAFTQCCCAKDINSAQCVKDETANFSTAAHLNFTTVVRRFKVSVQPTLHTGYILTDCKSRHFHWTVNFDSAGPTEAKSMPIMLSPFTILIFMFAGGQ